MKQQVVSTRQALKTPRAAAVAGIIFAVLFTTSIVLMRLAIMYTITNVYAIRMAGVFMIALGTIWIRTRVMPRVFVFLTYALALVLLVSGNLTLWLNLVFPAWVFAISVYILIVSLRGEH